MSTQLSAAPQTNPHRSGSPRLDKLCTAIRGKLQFMDYLVRVAAADVDRLESESDAGTRIFLRQLIEMHAQNLAVECENMRLMGELCGTLESAVASAESEPANVSFQNGEVG